MGVPTNSIILPYSAKRDNVSAECDMGAKSTFRSEALKPQALTCLYVFVLLPFMLSLCEGPFLLDQLRLNFRKTCILGRGGRDF